MHQPVTSLGISTAQNVSFGRNTQALAQQYACMNFKSAMPDANATEVEWKTHERQMREARTLARLANSSFR